MKQQYYFHYTKRINQPDLTLMQIKKIVELHGYNVIILNQHIYGIIPFINASTNEQGFDITDITFFTYSELRDYLGY